MVGLTELLLPALSLATSEASYNHAHMCVCV